MVGLALGSDVCFVVSEQTLDRGCGVSALPPGADMLSVGTNVCLVPTADIAPLSEPERCTTASAEQPLA